MTEMVKTKEFKDFWDYFKTAIISMNQFAEYPEDLTNIDDEILEKTLREWKTKRKQRLKDIQFSHKVLSIMNENQKMMTIEDLIKKTNSSKEKVHKAIKFLKTRNLIQTSFEVL